MLFAGFKKDGHNSFPPELDKIFYFGLIAPIIYFIINVIYIGSYPSVTSRFLSPVLSGIAEYLPCVYLVKDYLREDQGARFELIGSVYAFGFLSFLPFLAVQVPVFFSLRKKLNSYMAEFIALYRKSENKADTSESAFLNFDGSYEGPFNKKGILASSSITKYLFYFLAIAFFAIAFHGNYYARPGIFIDNEVYRSDMGLYRISFLLFISMISFYGGVMFHHIHNLLSSK